ncbi:hypothetical protein NQ318_001618 [Aromia moschata]|uniref:MADF domain-containing protein n=1 Tax=Aromia moschata TaxID=1265417 RepID=A0AAV8Y2J7_9CUCU|nr:hypothetical protein NQ318_001618 [Aromia moschata]
MEWSNENILAFLDFYEAESIVWNSGHNDHKNRNLVYDAWKRIERNMGGRYSVAETDKCNKCRTEKSYVVLRRKDVYCKNCFLTGTIHKFKALLGKSRLVRPNDKVLIYHKIGHPSTALLHFLRTGLDLNTPKKIRFEIDVLFIEDQYQLTVDERQDVIKKIKEEVTAFGFKIHFIPFIKYISDNSISEIMEYDNLHISGNDESKLLANFEKISNTNKNEIMNLMKRRLLVDVAKHLDCKFIFLPDTSVETASNLLSNMSLGRGCHVPFDTGFCDDREDVKILRPLRLFDMKELAFLQQI